MPEIPDNELADLRKKADAADSAAAAADAAAKQLATTTEHLTAATETARGFARTAHPDLPEQAFAGATPSELAASVTAARQIADHVKAQTTPQAPAPAGTTASVVVPPGGANTRDAQPDTSKLKGAALIKAGLEQRSKAKS